MVRISDFMGKNIFITGGSSGIGLAAAGMFASKGANVVISARNVERLEKAAGSIDGNVHWKCLDVTDWEAVRRTAIELAGEHGRFDVVVNSAGIVHPSVLGELTEEEIRSIIDIDLVGTMAVCKSFMEIMNRPGYMINISSVAGFVGIYGYTAYSAAKFGVWGFSQALRMELEPEGIGVGVVFPPDTDTPQLEFENRTKPDELKAISGKIRSIPPERVAKAIFNGIRKGDFLIFADGSSRSLFHATRIAEPLVRGWMDSRISSASREKGEGKQ
ncbi:MAG: SDR family oxidoreductase [Thermoplasmatota archaeon]